VPKINLQPKLPFKEQVKSQNKQPLSPSQKLQEKKLITTLISIDGIGRTTLRRWLKILKKYEQTPNELWVGKQSICRLCRVNEKIQESIKNFKKEHTIESYWELLKKKKVSVVLDSDDNYPSLLKHADDRPLLLYVKGDVFGEKNSDIKTPIWEKNPVAVVGTRRITGYGAMATEKITKEIVTAGGTIISGFMYGVDVCAQRMALSCGGQTVGVLGFGFDHMYPKSHQQLFRWMLERGAVFVSEFAPHISPKAGQFPSRNRIIAGMSLGVIVTEAAKRSGSVITAECALDYGRDVFAVPGAITSPYSEGTKKLINQGAVLVGSGQEVVEELESSWPEWGWSGSDEEDQNQEKVVNVIKREVKSVDSGNGKKYDAKNSNESVSKLVKKVSQSKNKDISKRVITKLKEDGRMNVDDLATGLGESVSVVTVCLVGLEIEGVVRRSGGVWVVG